MGLLTKNDSTIFRGYFKEMAKLRGITVIYQYPIDMNFTIYAEEIPKGFSEEITEVPETLGLCKAQPPPHPPSVASALDGLSKPEDVRTIG